MPPSAALTCAQCVRCAARPRRQDVVDVLRPLWCHRRQQHHGGVVDEFVQPREIHDLPARPLSGAFAWWSRVRALRHSRSGARPLQQFGFYVDLALRCFAKALPWIKNGSTRSPSVTLPVARSGHGVPVAGLPRQACTVIRRMPRAPSVVVRLAGDLGVIRKDCTRREHFRPGSCRVRLEASAWAGCFLVHQLAVGRALGDVMTIWCVQGMAIGGGVDACIPNRKNRCAQ